MFANEELFLDFLGTPQTQLVVPVYQRVYVWSEKQCRALWNDCMRAGAGEVEHFIGTVLFAEETGDNGARQFSVIDGQQRCATITLLLMALRDHLAECESAGQVLGELSAAELEERYLKVDGAGKLMLGRADQATLAAFLQGAELPEEDDLSQNVADNYALFKGLMGESFGPEGAARLLQGLRHLSVIAARLDDEDEPQLIFESLNGKGLPLTTGDLIRNLLLADESLEDQERFYEQYWAPIERLYSGEDGDIQLNAALRGWLAVTAPKLSKGVKDEVYDVFKQYLRENKTRDLEGTLKGLKSFCENFAAKAQFSSTSHEQKDWDSKRAGVLISERKLFGD